MLTEFAAISTFRFGTEVNMRAVALLGIHYITHV